MTSTSSWHVFRLLLSLVVRLRQSIGCITLALRARLASLWTSILTFASRSGKSQIPSRLCANNVTTGEPARTSEPEKVEEENRGTLAALPVRNTADWGHDLSTYQVMTSGHHFKFQPVAATPDGGSQRYIPRSVNQSVEAPEIPAGQERLLSALPRLPDDWTRHVHPEGNVLFYHKKLRIFTESDISIRRNREEIMFYATTLIQTAIETDGVTMDELTEIVLNMDSSQHCHYYFVDHTHRLLFWVHPMKPQKLDVDLRGISEYTHIRYLVEEKYWYVPGHPSGLKYIVYDMESRTHCEFYPHNRTLPDGIYGNLRGMLNYAQTDMMTADSSTSPFAKDELVAILDLVNSLKDDRKISDAYSIWVIARIMTYFTENQVLNFCGQECARLNADTPLFDQPTWKSSAVFKIVNLLLLGSPSDHAVRLEWVWVDGIIIQRRWKDFISRLTADLARYTIFSTVMLAVNFSFLAVPGVVTVGSPASQTQILIYCSVVSTIGSILFSFILLNVYSDLGLMTAGLAAEAMRKLGQKRWGMACLAVMHSLPISCLVWSIALFSTALAILIFGPKQHPTVATLGAECLILLLLGLMTGAVVRTFSLSEDDGDDGDASAGNNSATTPRRQDVERGLGRWFVFYGR